MTTAPARLRKQIAWRINGRPLEPGEWVCTSFVGRGDVAAVSHDRCAFALWEAEIPYEAFLKIYTKPYREIVLEEQAQTPYEWGVVLEYDQLRHLGYPGLDELLGSHPQTLRNLLVGDDAALLELIYLDEPGDYARGYSVHSLNEVVFDGGNVRLVGIAVGSDR